MIHPTKWIMHGFEFNFYKKASFSVSLKVQVQAVSTTLFPWYHTHLLSLTVEVVLIQEHVSAAFLAGVNIATPHRPLQIKHLCACRHVLCTCIKLNIAIDLLFCQLWSLIWANSVTAHYRGERRGKMGGQRLWRWPWRIQTYLKLQPNQLNKNTERNVSLHVDHQSRVWKGYWETRSMKLHNYARTLYLGGLVPVQKVLHYNDVQSLGVASFCVPVPNAVHSQDLCKHKRSLYVVCVVY